ncbi:MAG: CvpA family protein [Alphaproteobacteria bacterium]|nr:CvpA family protein [Alphaproteobacteria bacterium]MBV9693525.1 CvpA family protein [Alphaproteobacteria bacterium]
MSMLGITYVDPIVVIVVLVSALYATYRGFASETLSIFAWAAAAFATLFLGPKLAPFVRGLFSSPFLGVLAGYAAIFVIVLVPLSFLSFRFSEQVKHSPVSTLDRSLGTAFGIVRGLAIVGLAYIAFTAMVPVRSQPGWIANARTLPLIRVSAQALLSLVPDQHSEPLTAPRPAVATAAAQSAQSPQTPLPQPKPVPQKHRKKAYGARDRSELDRLIDNTSQNGHP